MDPEYLNLPVETVDVWRRAPENVVAEIIDGELSTRPGPAPRCFAYSHSPHDSSSGAAIEVVDRPLRHLEGRGRLAERVEEALQSALVLTTVEREHHRIDHRAW